VGKVIDIKAKDNTLYLIVVKEVWDRIVEGTKITEYREATDYWTKRILNKSYEYVKITNGYGNQSRPYRLYRYGGATRVMKNSIQHYSIPIYESMIIEKRDKVNGTTIHYPNRLENEWIPIDTPVSMPDEDICHYSGLPSTSSYDLQSK